MRPRLILVLTAAAALLTPIAAAQAASQRLPSGRTSYRSYGDYVRELAALPAQRPSIARAVTLDEPSVQGRTIHGVELAAGVREDNDGRPTYLVTGLTHAREWPSGEIAMEFARDLASGYGRDARITRLLGRVRVVVVPVLNSDGFIASRTAPVGSSARLHRTNCALSGSETAATPCALRAGVDLNRNQAAGWGGAGADPDPGSPIYRGPEPWSEPESRGLHDLMRSRQVTGMISLHNYDGSVLRQPGYRAFGRLPDEARQARLGAAMAAAAGYRSEPADALYEATGGQEDWSYAHQDSLAFTIELGGGSFQPAYRAGVIEQYLGRRGSVSAGRGMRDALLLGAEAAGRTSGHGVIEGRGTPERLLRLQRSFVTRTSPVCPTDPSLASCPSALAPIAIPDGIATWLRVPSSGHFRWDVAPSTDPQDERAGRTTAWTLRCEAAEGFVLGSRQVTVRRGQRRTIAGLCSG